MKKRMADILKRYHKYNAPNSAQKVFGFDPNIDYDALVVAPSFIPQKLFANMDCKITTLREATYTGGYLLEIGGQKIAWIKTASSASNCIDHMAICAELSFKKLVFVGAAGGLKPDFQLGDICTPSCCICGNYANTYLKPSIHDFVPFERVNPQMGYIQKVITQLNIQNLPIKLACVFCTDSIVLEYSHLEEIRAFDADLIEMETSSFYLMADLLEIPAIALLVVSDNSATGTALVGRTAEESLRYNKARAEVLPRIMQEIFSI